MLLNILDNSDLHIHSNFSDGKYTPFELICMARKVKLRQISITDHNYIHKKVDTDKYRSFAKSLGIEFIEGVEISAQFGGRAVHVLCYSNNFTKRKHLNNFLESNRNIYNKRGIKLVKKVKQMGFQISIGDFYNFPYIHKNIFAKICNEKFGKGLEFWKAIRVDEKLEFPEIAEIAKLIRESNGIVVLAHPGKLCKDLDNKAVLKFIQDINKISIDGIEVYHPDNTKELVKLLKQFTFIHKLTMTSGSDFHSEQDSSVELGYHHSMKQIHNSPNITLN